MNPIVDTFEQQLLPQFKIFAENLIAEFPNLKASVRSHSFDSRGGCYTLYIDCLIPDIPDDRPDNIALSVMVERLLSSPTINADVCWGHPSGYIEAELAAEALQVSDETIAALHIALPGLFDSLHRAIKKGEPSL